MIALWTRPTSNTNNIVSVKKNVLNWFQLTVFHKVRQYASYGHVFQNIKNALQYQTEVFTKVFNLSFTHFLLKAHLYVYVCIHMYYHIWNCKIFHCLQLHKPPNAFTSPNFYILLQNYDFFWHLQLVPKEILLNLQQITHIQNQIEYLNTDWKTSQKECNHMFA